MVAVPEVIYLVPGSIQPLETTSRALSYLCVTVFFEKSFETLPLNCINPVKTKTLSNRSLNKGDKRENNYIRISKPRKATMKIPMCFLANEAKKETVFSSSKRSMYVCLKFS